MIALVVCGFFSYARNSILHDFFKLIDSLDNKDFLYYEEIFEKVTSDKVTLPVPAEKKLLLVLI